MLRCVVLWLEGADVAGPAGRYPCLVARVVVDVQSGALQVGRYLNPTGAVADDGYAFARRVECWIPVGCVTEETFEVLESRIVRETPVVEVAERGDDEVEGL